MRWSALVIASLAVFVSDGTSAIELPPGFSHTTLLTGEQLPDPVAIAWLPDGRLWIAQSGRSPGLVVWLRRPDSTLVRALTLSGRPDGEQGIHGIAVDPAFDRNGHVWIYYSSLAGTPTRNRLSRFSAVNERLEQEEVLLESPFLQNASHNGGCLAFAADGSLFLGTGDDSQGSSTSQNPFDLRGKILRLGPDGTPAAGNPFADGIAGDPRVWATGVRNPFRCNVQPESDNLFFGDVGQAAWEEVNVGVRGANYGWAAVEGPEPPGLPGFVYPIHAYSHDGANAAVIGGVHVAADDFDPALAGDYLFGDFARREIRRMRLDSSNVPVSIEPWASDVGSIVDLEFGPDGALYYVSRWSEATAIGRIEHVGGSNRQPRAVAVALPDSGPGPLRVILDGTGSSDPDGGALTHRWETGDGETTESAIVEHTYHRGQFEARLTVVDEQGSVDRSAPLRIVSGNERPLATIDAPQGGTFDAGDVIEYVGEAIDPEEGAIPCSQIGWQVIFHHEQHAHPFLGPEQGRCSGSFVASNTGETSAEIRYEIRMTATDSGEPAGSDLRLSGAASVVIQPNTSTFTLASEPLAGLRLTLDTVPLTAPLSVKGVVGFVRQLGAPEFQLAADGHTYRWLAWSDGGDREHALSTPAADTTITARFGCDVITPVDNLKLHATPVGNARRVEFEWDASTDPCVADASQRYRVYAALEPAPAEPPGRFPSDPLYTLIGTTGRTRFHYLAPAEHRYYLVVAGGTDEIESAPGHYGK